MASPTSSGCGRAGDDQLPRGAHLRDVDLGLPPALALKDLCTLAPLSLCLELHGRADAGGRGDVTDLVSQAL